MKSERKNNYDILRIISSIAVILLHVNAYYFRDRAYAPNMSYHYVIESLINIVTRFSVPVFVMMSGALTLTKKENNDFKEFYQKISYKIILFTLGAGLIIFVADEIIQIFSAHNYLLAVKCIILGSFYNFWFIYMIIGLYVLTPFIVHIKQWIGFRRYAAGTGVLLVLSCVSQATSHYILPYSIGVIFSFLSYYMLGDIICEMHQNMLGGGDTKSII